MSNLPRRNTVIETTKTRILVCILVCINPEKKTFLRNRIIEIFHRVYGQGNEYNVKYMCICVSDCVCICEYICVSVCVYICVCICVHMWVCAQFETEKDRKERKCFMLSCVDVYVCVCVYLHNCLFYIFQYIGIYYF